MVYTCQDPQLELTDKYHPTSVFRDTGRSHMESSSLTSYSYTDMDTIDPPRLLPYPNLANKFKSRYDYKSITGHRHLPPLTYNTDMIHFHYCQIPSILLG